MQRLKWSASHVVFFPVMDDEHKEIFESLSALQTAVSSGAPASEIEKSARALAARVEGHFAHEERLMKAARYGSFQWHKQKHDGARKRVVQFVSRIEDGESEAGAALVEYLTDWLDGHTRLADMMLGSFLRNHQRNLCKVTLRAGTKPADACEWIGSDGERFDPSAGQGGG